MGNVLKNGGPDRWDLGRCVTGGLYLFEQVGTLGILFLIVAKALPSINQEISSVEREQDFKGGEIIWGWIMIVYTRISFLGIFWRVSFLENFLFFIFRVVFARFFAVGSYE